MADVGVYWGFFVPMFLVLIGLHTQVYPRNRRVIENARQSIMSGAPANPLTAADFFTLHDRVRRVDKLEDDVNGNIAWSIRTSFAMIISSAIGLGISYSRFFVELLPLVDMALVAATALLLINLLPLFWRLR